MLSSAEEQGGDSRVPSGGRASQPCVRLSVVEFWLPAMAVGLLVPVLKVYTLGVVESRDGGRGTVGTAVTVRAKRRVGFSELLLWGRGVA